MEVEARLSGRWLFLLSIFALPLFLRPILAPRVRTLQACPMTTLRLILGGSTHSVRRLVHSGRRRSGRRRLDLSKQPFEYVGRFTPRRCSSGDSIGQNTSAMTA